MLTAYHSSIEAFLWCIRNELHLSVSQFALWAHFKPSTRISLIPKCTLAIIFASCRYIRNRPHPALLVEVGNV
jgi:hypothetical protein